MCCFISYFLSNCVLLSLLIHTLSSMPTEQLLTITRLLLASSTFQEELQASHLLAAFYRQHASSITASSDPRQYTADTIIEGGVALSSAEAAICVDDYIRTARFLKGIHAALTELQERFPSTTLNVLYAGSGPYATLILPLLPLFGKNDLKITLLDINPSSVSSVQALLAKLNLGSCVDSVICDDATRYRYPATEPLHLVISETMFHALIREPQVSITLNLAPQITPGGILIPESISLDLAQAFFAKERYWSAADNDPVNPQKAHMPYNHPPLPITHLFKVAKDTIFRIPKEKKHSFTTNWLPVPIEFSDRPDLCIFTQIIVFGSVTLDPSASFITNPYCAISIYNMMHAREYRLTYDFSGIPSWSVELRE
jgi:hypothetical protein